MCVDVSYQLRRAIKYAEHANVDEDEIQELRDKLKQLEAFLEYKETTHLNAFTHPEVPIITALKPRSLLFFELGLVPHWVTDPVKADKIRKGIINARAETVHELPSFKESIRERRCLVLLDGFFEHHHISKSKKIPFYIWRKDKQPMVFAGIYDFAVLDGIHHKTVSILTTRANAFMAKIHNKDRIQTPNEMPDPRMPVILEKEDFDEWLMEDSYPRFLQPQPEGMLEAHTVEKLRDKFGVVRHPEILDKFTYRELPRGVDSIKPPPKQLGLF